MNVRCVSALGFASLLFGSLVCGCTTSQAPAAAQPPASQAEAMEAGPADEQAEKAHEAADAPFDGVGAGAAPAPDGEAQGQQKPTSLGELDDEEEAVALDTLEGASAMLERSVAELDEMFGKKKATRDRAATGAKGLGQGSAACVEACEAFGSLERAANAICRLAGEDAPRCREAREVVKENESRIAPCNCDERRDE